eukprot:scaffold16860_cov63-Phaeocystis_antarctica.AAC.1
MAVGSDWSSVKRSAGPSSSHWCRSSKSKYLQWRCPSLRSILAAGRSCTWLLAREDRRGSFLPLTVGATAASSSANQGSLHSLAPPSSVPARQYCQAFRSALMVKQPRLRGERVARALV